jgi:predicted RNA-binding Zn ribbon-like protein
MEVDHKGEFLFVGNQLALDFLNTRPVLAGETTELLRDESALLRWFVAAGLLSVREVRGLQRAWGETAARRGLEAVRAFRERLRQEVIAWEEGKAVGRSMVAELNEILATYPMRTQIEVRDGGLRSRLSFAPKEPQELLSPIAHAAAMLFANVERGRVRQCGGCVLHFYDNSKKGNRRWCSMKFCGNRVKVAAYAARQRASEA